MMTQLRTIILFIFTISSACLTADIELIEFYVKNHEYESARARLLEAEFHETDVSLKSYYHSAVGYTYQLEGQHSNAIRYYRESLQSGLDSNMTNLVNSNLSISYFLSDQFEIAFSLIKKTDPSFSHDLHLSYIAYTCEINSPGKENFSDDEIEAIRVLKSSLKSPIKARLFSIIIPGAGQVYSNHYIDGVQSAFIVGLSLFFTNLAYNSYNNDQMGMAAPVVSTAATLLLHYANILSAYRTAIYRNINLKTNFMSEKALLIEPFNLIEFLPQPNTQLIQDSQ